MNSKIMFPAMDLSFNDEDWINMEGIFIEDEYLYFNSIKKFNKKYLSHILVDSKGSLYEIIGKDDLSKWRKLFPFIKKSRLKLKSLDRKMTLNDIKLYYIKKMKVYDVLDEEYHAHIMDNISKIEKIKTVNDFFKENV